MNLSETRKADREKMAGQVEALASRIDGWKAERSQHHGPREIQVNLTGPFGLSVNVDFDGDSWQPDVFCLPWHFKTGTDGYEAYRDVKLDDVFGWMQASSVNPVHRRKCTSFADGFEALMRKLETGMTMANGTEENGNTAFLHQEIAA